MGSNNNSTAERAARSGTTVITQGTKLTGDINLDGVLHLDGHLGGNLTSSSDVSIGSSGSVEGNILADTVYVSGKVMGNIKANSVQLLNGCLVEGEIHSSELMIEEKGVINGKVAI